MKASDLQTLHPLILDSISEGVFTVDADFRITYLNAAARRITGLGTADAMGRRCFEVLRGSVCQSGCPLKRSIDTGEPQVDVEVKMLNTDMDTVPISVSTAAMRDPRGRLIGGVEVFRDISDVETLRRELSDRQSVGDIVGVSPAMREIFGQLEDVAESEVSVLIQGASGTGKELVARALHDRSPRRAAPFVRVNCGALPDTLLESELFGHVRGAFTDARRDRPGRFQQADGGTLFLDEVGDLSAAFQVKLLRALQEGEIQPLGGTEMLTVDVRILAATHRDLPRMIREGSFREDLFYRLAVMPLTLPPLRERREDIPPLIDRLVARLAARTGKPIRELSTSALTALMDHDYPGNVRELMNILERAFVLCHGRRIERRHLPPALVEPLSDAAGPWGSRWNPGRLKPSERTLLARADAGDGAGPRERATHGVGEVSAPGARALIDVLEAHRWNRKATAETLGISRSTLWRRMKDYGLI